MSLNIDFKKIIKLFLRNYTIFYSLLQYVSFFDILCFSKGFKISEKEKLRLELSVILALQKLAQYKIDNKYNYSLKKEYRDIINDLKLILSVQKANDPLRFEANIKQIEEFRREWQKN